MAKLAQTSKMAKVSKLTKITKITTAVKMVNFSKLAEMAEMSKVAKNFKFTEFGNTDKMPGIAQTIKRDFDGRKGRDSHIEQNDLSDQDSQIGPQWPGLAKRDKMAKVFEFDSIAEKSKEPT